MPETVPRPSSGEGEQDAEQEQKEEEEACQGRDGKNNSLFMKIMYFYIIFLCVFLGAELLYESLCM